MLENENRITFMK